MTDRQRKFVLALAGLCLGCMIVYGAVTKLFVEPYQTRVAQQKFLINENARLARENSREVLYRKTYNDLAGQMISGAEAGSYLDATIMTLLDASRLTGRLQSSEQLHQETVSGAVGFKQIGRNIRVKGPLANLVDLMYLLEAQPFLHCLDNLTFNRDAATGECDLAFHYTALVVDAAKNTRYKPASSPASQAVPVQDLDQPQRRLYDAIAGRDVFRPYIKRIVAERPSPSPTPQPSPEHPAQPARQELFVCGLVTWQDGQQEIAIRNGAGEVRCYKPGDKLESGEIVMIDYRAMPRPDNPKLDSPSRLILKIGQEYWAVELERSLSDKRLLKPDQYPPELRPRSSSAPSEPAGQTSARS